VLLNGLALIGLGISISLDELAIGFTIGPLHLPIALAVILIGTQASLVAQLRLRLGEAAGERAHLEQVRNSRTRPSYRGARA
jgi:putative Mn2+ efflux pump MntP